MIAQRARFKRGFNQLKGLNQGEAFLGDFQTCGMSEHFMDSTSKSLSAQKASGKFVHKSVAVTTAFLASLMAHKEATEDTSARD